ETAARLSPDQLGVLAARLGDPDLSPAEVAECADMITDSGGLAAVESYIAAKHAQAQSRIDAWASGGLERIRLGGPAEDRLTEFATALSYRTRCGLRTGRSARAGARHTRVERAGAQHARVLQNARA